MERTAVALATNTGAQDANVLHAVGTPPWPHGDLAGVDRSELPLRSDAGVVDRSPAVAMSIAAIGSLAGAMRCIANAHTAPSPSTPTWSASTPMTSDAERARRAMEVCIVESGSKFQLSGGGVCGRLRLGMTRARSALVQRGLWLNYLTIGYNSVEAAVSLIAGVLSGSAALVGFGVDSVIEVTASGAAQWRLRADMDEARRESVERTTARIIGWCFIALATYVVYDGGRSMLLRDRPERSIVGIAILALSVVVMPLLSRAKRRVARAMQSRALEADATQTTLCAYLSGIGLIGLALNASLGWWWADPIAALMMAPIIALEGIKCLRREVTCDDGCRD